MSTVECFRVHGDTVDDHWDAIAAVIEGKGGLQNFGEFDLPDVREWLKDGKMQALVFYEDGEAKAVCTTEIVVYPRYKTIRIVNIAGEGRLFWPYWNDLQIWAEDLGAKFIETLSTLSSARWAEMHMPKYKKVYVILRAEVESSGQREE